MNVGILGISELKWTGMGEFNSGDHYNYYIGEVRVQGHGNQKTDLLQERLLWDARGWDFKMDPSKPEPGENDWGHDEGQERVSEGPSCG